MDKLKELLSKCKCGVYVEVNSHRDYYQSVELYMNEEPDFKEDTPKDVLIKMIDTNTIVSIQCYPYTPVSFLKVYHYDLDKALDECIEAINFTDKKSKFH